MFTRCQDFDPSPYGPLSMVFNMNGRWDYRCTIGGSTFVLQVWHDNGLGDVLRMGAEAWHGTVMEERLLKICSYLLNYWLTMACVYIILYNTHSDIWIHHITFLHFPVLWLYIQYMDISWYSLYLWMNFLLPVFARLFVESSRIVSTAMRFRGPTSFWAAGSLGIHSYLYWLSRCPPRMIDVVRENRCSRWE